MVNRKMASVALASMLSVGVITGCGGGKASTTSTTATTAEGGVIDPTNAPRPVATSTASGIATTSVPGDGKDTGISIEKSPGSSKTTASSSTTTSSGITAAPTAPSKVTANSECSESDAGKSANTDSNIMVSCTKGADGKYRWNSGGASSTTPSSNGSSSTSKTTSPTNVDPNEASSSNPLPYPDGTTAILSITQTNKIYATPDTSSEVLGEAKQGGQFKGTISKNGNWVKIDRSPGYVSANGLTVSKVIK